MVVCSQPGVVVMSARGRLRNGDELEKTGNNPRSWLSTPVPRTARIRGDPCVSARGRGCGPPAVMQKLPTGERAGGRGSLCTPHMQFMPRSPRSTPNGRLCTTERIEITALADTIAVPRRKQDSQGSGLDSQLPGNLDRIGLPFGSAPVRASPESARCEFTTTGLRISLLCDSVLGGDFA